MALLTNVLGAAVLIVTAAGAYYANGLKSALEGSELATVWKHIGLGVILLFLGAIAGGIVSYTGDTELALDVTLLAVLVAAGGLLNGLKLQLDKVK